MVYIGPSRFPPSWLIQSGNQPGTYNSFPTSSSPSLSGPTKLKDPLLAAQETLVSSSVKNAVSCVSRSDQVEERGKKEQGRVHRVQPVGTDAL